MKFLKIAFFTIVSGLLGFIVGYILFSKYGNEFIPLENIFKSTLLEDAVLNGFLNLKFKILGTAAWFALAGLIVSLLLVVKGSSRSSNKGFFQCKFCDFKYHQSYYFCPACEHDEHGKTKEDYKAVAKMRVAANRQGADNNS